MMLAPTLFTSCNVLPPEGALRLRLRLGGAGSAALAGEDQDFAPVGSCTTLPLRGLIFPS